MKNLIFLIALLSLAFCTPSKVQAQHASTRYTVYGANDASSKSYGTLTATDTLGATVDTTKFSPRYQETNLAVTVKDSCSITYRSLAPVYYNDRLYMYITCPAQTGFIYLYGNFIVSTGTKKISLTANKHCLLEFWFDGTNYVEVSRNLNY